MSLPVDGLPPSLNQKLRDVKGCLFCISVSPRPNTILGTCIKICELMTKMTSLPFQRRKRPLLEGRKAASSLLLFLFLVKISSEEQGGRPPHLLSSGNVSGENEQLPRERAASQRWTQGEPGSWTLVSSAPIFKFYIVSITQMFLGSPSFNKVRYGHLLRRESERKSIREGRIVMKRDFAATLGVFKGIKLLTIQPHDGSLGEEMKELKERQTHTHTGKIIRGHH